jgi:DnaJ-class molecular chaperone
MGKHSKKVSCSVCDGEGKIKRNMDNKEIEVKCSACNGTGKV